MLRPAIAWFAASIVTYILGAVAMTQVVLFELGAIGVQVAFTDRIAMTLYDIVGMALSYLPLVAVALAIGFFVASRLAARRPRWRRPLFLLAGASAMLALILLAEAALGVNPLSGARSVPAILLQLAAGVAGGLAFTGLLPARGQA
jgi:hypothetical protein